MTYERLREMALAMTPARIGLGDLPPRQPYGALMEFDVDGDTATLAAFLNGDSSIYLSFGGGIIGGGQHESSAVAAAQFVRQAEAYLGRMTRTAHQPRPASGQVNFYLLTGEGIFGITVLEQSLIEGKDEFSPLYVSGHEVIAQLRLIQQRKQAH